LERQLATVTRELERLAGALAVGGDLQTLVQAFRDREAQGDTLTTQIASMTGAERAAKVDWKTVEQQLRATLEEWRQLLCRHVPQARQVLKKRLLETIVFTPRREATERHYSFRASVNLGKLLAGIACANMVASPTGVAITRSFAVACCGERRRAVASPTGTATFPVMHYRVAV